MSSLNINISLFSFLYTVLLINLYKVNNKIIMLLFFFKTRFLHWAPRIFYLNKISSSHQGLTWSRYPTVCVAWPALTTPTTHSRTVQTVIWMLPNWEALVRHTGFPRPYTHITHIHISSVCHITADSLTFWRNNINFNSAAIQRSDYAWKAHPSILILLDISVRFPQVWG